MRCDTLAQRAMGRRKAPIGRLVEAMGRPTGYRTRRWRYRRGGDGTLPPTVILLRFPSQDFPRHLATLALPLRKGYGVPEKFIIFGESGGSSRLTADVVSSQCDLVAERERKGYEIPALLVLLALLVPL